MKNDQAVTAILVTYNSENVIAQALHSLQAQEHIAAITVVDNASSDATIALIRREFPQATVIENPKNEGYGRASNIALERVETPYALLVNPDAVLRSGCVAALLEAAAAYPDAALLAPRLSDETGRLQHSHKRSVFAREKKRDAFTDPEGDLCAEFLSGALWLLDMKRMRQVGFFDPAIFLYYEDDDLCLRVRASGYGLVLVHGAEAMHIGNASSGDAPRLEAEFNRQKLMSGSRLYLEQKYHGEAAARKLATRLRGIYGFKIALYSLRCNRRKAARYRGRLAGISAFGNHP